MKQRTFSQAECHLACGHAARQTQGLGQKHGAVWYTLFALVNLLITKNEETHSMPKVRPEWAKNPGRGAVSPIETGKYAD